MSCPVISNFPLVEKEDSTLESFYPTCSYVKWLEAAGAQVVPVIISIDDNEDLTEYFQEVIFVLNDGLFL